MAFTSIRELTFIESVALAFVEFGHNRFTRANLVGYLCSFLDDPFKVRFVKMVDDLLCMAESEGLVQASPGQRGGSGFQITALGAELVSDIELPLEKFERRSKFDDERQIEASSNPAPVFSVLLNVIPKDEIRCREFIQSLGLHWVTHGWLSSKQVTKMVAIGERYGEFIEGKHYIGTSLEEWRAPYVEQLRINKKEQYRLKEEQRELARVHALACEKERKEIEQAKSLIREANRKVKITLSEMEKAGELNELDRFVMAVFPEVNLSEGAKSIAFAGRGSKQLRTCIAAIAFGCPPALIWQNVGSMIQPDAESEVWKQVIRHDAFQILRPNFKEICSYNKN